jgi:hypothetical protein
MSSKKPEILKTRKKRAQPSSSSSNQPEVLPFNPVTHGLHLEEHFTETTYKASQVSTTVKDCLKSVNSVNAQIDEIVERKSTDPEFKKISIHVKQLIMTISLLSTKVAELEKANNENQAAFELFKSSTYEYLLSTVYNDAELIAQFEQPVKTEKIKTENPDNEDSDNDEDIPEKNISESQAAKKKPIRRGLLPPECR